MEVATSNALNGAFGALSDVQTGQGAFTYDSVCGLVPLKSTAPLGRRRRVPGTVSPCWRTRLAVNVDPALTTRFPVSPSMFPIDAVGRLRLVSTGVVVVPFAGIGLPYLDHSFRERKRL